jgi:hypothetical protein
MRDAAVLVTVKERADATRVALGSLARSFADRPFDLFVWDNGSDRELDRVAGLFTEHARQPMLASWVFDRAPSWEPPTWTKNRAVERFLAHLATRTTPPAWVAYLDNDVDLAPRWLGESIALLGDERVAAAGIRIVAPVEPGNDASLGDRAFTARGLRVCPGDSAGGCAWVMAYPTAVAIGAAPGRFVDDQWLPVHRCIPRGWRFGIVLDHALGALQKVPSSRTDDSFVPVAFPRGGR